MKIHLPLAVLCFGLLTSCDETEPTITGPETSDLAQPQDLEALGAKPVCPGHPSCGDSGSEGYKAVNLGSLPGGNGSKAYDINDDYQIAGESEFSDPGLGAIDVQATLWTTTSTGRVLTVQDLGNLGGGGSSAQGINNLGQVVGRSTNSHGFTRPFVWTESGGIRELSVPPPFCHGTAYDISDQGEAVGDVSCSGNPSHVMHWTVALDGSETASNDLGTLGGTSAMAFAVNSDGTVSGHVRPVGGSNVVGYIWTQSAGVNPINGTAEALGISDNGVVVGWTTSPNIAFRWTAESGLTLLGTLGGDHSVAIDVNELGQIVGASPRKKGVQRHPFSWEHGVMSKLPYLKGYGLGEAHGVNEFGAIAGWTGGSRGTFAMLWVR